MKSPDGLCEGDGLGEGKGSCEQNRSSHQDRPCLQHQDRPWLPSQDGPFGPVPTPPHGWTWHALMDMALAEARMAAASGEVPVGALIVSADGNVLATAHNEPIGCNDPSAHAEMLAIRRAAAKTENYRLDGAYLVVTLEPCLMCTGAIVHARLAGVVYGAPDHKAGAVSSCLDGFDLPFLNHKPWHMAYVRHAACAELLKTFFAQRRD